MRPLLRTVRDVSFGILTAWAVQELTPRAVFWITERRLNAESRILAKKEGSMDPVFDARSINLLHLNPVRVSYHPKDIHTEAIQVSIENVGKLSLEFETELYYEAQGRPYFVFMSKRFDAGEPDGQTSPHELYVRLSDWIVPLWDELHVFRDAVFQNTFTFDDPKPEREYTMNTPMLVPPVEIPKPFKPNDRVYVGETGEYGTVTVVDIDRGVELPGVEVLLDSTGQRYLFDPNSLEISMSGHSSGKLEGPHGTGFLPRAE